MTRVCLGILCVLSTSIMAVPASAVKLSAFALDALIADQGDNRGVWPDNGDTIFVGGAAHLNIPLSQTIFAQLEFSGGEFLDEGTLIEAGTHLFYQTRTGRTGIFYAHSAFEGFTGDQLALEWEHYDDQWLTVRGTVGYEFKNLSAEDLRFGGLLLRLYPTKGKNFMFESGLFHVGETSKALKITDIDVLGIRMELLLEKLNLSIFFESYRRNDREFRTLGIRYFLGERKTLIRRHREDGIFNVQ